MSDFKFSLAMDEVPAPPESKNWADYLRWMVCVMDPDDTRFAFIASCLSQAVKYNGLTEKQMAACQKILTRVHAEYSEGILVCQNTTPASATNEANMTQGRLN